MPHSRHDLPALRRLIILGSTGSIGVSTLAVIEHLQQETSRRFEVVGLASGSNSRALGDQADRWNVSSLAIAHPSESASLARAGRRVFEGAGAAVELVEAVARKGDMIVAAMVGSAGLPAVLAGIRRGCDIALANKETLVAAGALVLPLVREQGVNLLPIDSEHSAVFQCLAGSRRPEEIARIVLTASGGPFRTWSRERLERATLDEALNHPTWNMGAKVTIDSATLMNKALEIIEAHWLFGLEAGRIGAIIHPQSIVHSFVEFCDGSVLAQMSPPDMRGPIQLALTWPDRCDGCAPALDWTALRDLCFEPIDHARFPAIGMAWRAVSAGGTAGAILNAANEVAVAAFLNHEISFGRITDVVGEVIESIPPQPVRSLDEILAADAEAREVARRLLASPSTVYG